MKNLIVVAMMIIPCFASATEPLAMTKTSELSAEGINSTFIECEGISLAVSGMKGATSIHVTVDIEVGGVKKEDLEAFVDKNLILTLEQKGKKAMIACKKKEPFLSFREMKVTMDVKLPVAMDIGIAAGSGALQITDCVGNIEIADGSGSIEMRKIVGDVVIDDGSGSIAVNDMRGRLSINDGSGSIVAETIDGDVTVRDGSGTIIIRKVSGNVTITDGSGDITIDGVDKDVKIGDAGSGAVNIANVKGNVSLDNE